MKKHKKIIKNLVVLGVSLGLIIFGILIFWASSLKLPDFSSFLDRKVVNSTKIYDRTGEIILFDIHQDIKRTEISISEMGDYIQKATVAIEDDNFYNHNGLQLKSILRAVVANLKSGELSQGGSTITQQVAKLTLLTSEKRFSRKFKEVFLALRIEKELEKDQILEIYLNEAPYGGSVYGIKEATNAFFGKNPIDLTLGEAAYLAAIPQAPTRYSPYGQNRDLLDARQKTVLRRMRQADFITEEEYQAALEEEVEFLPQSQFGIKAPHFVFYVRDYLTQKYGADVVDSGGLKVITTLDFDLQQKAEEVVLKHALENEELYDASNAGLVSVDPKTGDILTMVGSRAYFDEEIDGKFNIATAKRQPGSSFKPFIYSTAMRKGFTPDTVLFDTKTEFYTGCNANGRAKPGNDQENCYSPNNYDNAFIGPVSLRNALAQSRNVPSVKLLYLTTIKDSLKTAKDMGITTLADPNTYGLTLVLGGGEVSLLDMTSAYGVFANDGVRYEPKAVLRVEDKNGNILEDNSLIGDGQRVITENEARIISDILSDNVARTPLFGANSFVYFGERDVAGKTGTTNNNKDAWMMGYTPSIAVGVWSGNNDNTPMKKGSAISGRLWREFMDYALTRVPNERFIDPTWDSEITQKPIIRGVWQGGESYKIDTISGKLATEFTPLETTTEIVITDVHNILHWVDRSDPTGNPPNNPESNSQYLNWEASVQEWWQENKGNYEIYDEDDIPDEYDDIHTEDTIPTLEIENPGSTFIYQMDDVIDVIVDFDTEFPVESFDIFVNNNYMGSVRNEDFSFSFSPNEVPNISSINDLRIILRDSVYNQTEETQRFRVNI